MGWDGVDASLWFWACVVCEWCYGLRAGRLQGASPGRTLAFWTRVRTALSFLGVQLADTDLHQIIRSPQPLSDEHICFFLYQVRACMYLCRTCA